MVLGFADAVDVLEDLADRQAGAAAVEKRRGARVGRRRVAWPPSAIPDRRRSGDDVRRTGNWIGRAAPAARRRSGRRRRSPPGAERGCARSSPPGSGPGRRRRPSRRWSGAGGRPADAPGRSGTSRGDWRRASLPLPGARTATADPPGRLGDRGRCRAGGLVMDVADTRGGQAGRDGRGHRRVATDDHQCVVPGLQDPDRGGMAVPMGQAGSFVGQMRAGNGRDMAAIELFDGDQQIRVHQLPEQRTPHQGIGVVCRPAPGRRCCAPSRPPRMGTESPGASMHHDATRRVGADLHRVGGPRNHPGTGGQRVPATHVDSRGSILVHVGDHPAGQGAASPSVTAGCPQWVSDGCHIGVDRKMSTGACPARSASRILRVAAAR